VNLPAPPGFGRHTYKKSKWGGRENWPGLAPGRFSRTGPPVFLCACPLISGVGNYAAVEFLVFHFDLDRTLAYSLGYHFPA
jgi:hypothetical protein